MSRLKFQLESTSLQINDFAVRTLTELGNKMIIDVMHDQMRAANYSKKIIDRTFLAGVEIRNDRATLHIISDYTAENGFNVADAREKGTKKHMIQPKIQAKSATAGVSSGGPTVLSFILNGKRVFSKGHMVPGIKATHIVRDVIQLEEGNLEMEYRKKETIFLESQIKKNNNGGSIT